MGRNTRRPTAPLTSPQEVMDISLNLNNKKAPGKYGIKNIALIALPLYINAITYITKIFNRSLRLITSQRNGSMPKLQCYPSQKKDAKFTDNYRPISLLSCLGKTFEKILLTRIMDHCDRNHIIPEFLHDYRKVFSTQHQLLTVTNNIIHGFNTKTYTVGIFLDVKKAFDRMWRDGLIYKMIIFKFPTYLVKIIHHYLDNRSFKVKINSTSSNDRSIASGTPWVSILSPAIYNIYTSDFPTNPSVSVCLFADDAAILCNSTTADQAVRTTQAYLSQLEIWLIKWRIAINTEKNNAIVFRKI
ncbi:RNA-directed DNA polymerase from mobile element jockey [Trichonephila clavipes]|nr:RNA-directed DNA polymerase from mobile element jockey [Trichonephila clavipes]